MKTKLDEAEKEIKYLKSEITRNQATPVKGGAGDDSGLEISTAMEAPVQKFLQPWKLVIAPALPPGTITEYSNISIFQYLNIYKYLSLSLNIYQYISIPLNISEYLYISLEYLSIILHDSP